MAARKPKVDAEAERAALAEAAAAETKRAKKLEQLAAARAINAERVAARKTAQAQLAADIAETAAVEFAKVAPTRKSRSVNVPAQEPQPDNETAPKPRRSRKVAA